jgi:hypothetical protein
MQPADIRVRARVPTARWRGLPTGLVIGAQKAGTTALHRYLALHPDVHPPLRKETHYFSRYYRRGPAWYRAHFPIGNGVTFESTPYYLFHPLAPQRVAATLPDVRLVIIVRDPVERAFSHYRHSRRTGAEHLAFDQALAAEPERLQGEKERLDENPDYDAVAHRMHSYAARGRYAEQFERWLEHFDRDRFVVVAAEDLAAHPAETLHEVLDHLGLPRWAPPAFIPHNVGAGETLDPGLRAELAASFAADNARFAALVGRDFDWT